MANRLHAIDPLQAAPCEYTDFSGKKLAAESAEFGN